MAAIPEKKNTQDPIERHPGVFDHVTQSFLPDGGESETQTNQSWLLFFFSWIYFIKGKTGASSILNKCFICVVTAIIIYFFCKHV